MTPLVVAVGGGLGAGVRYAAGRWADGDWPWGTLLVNLVGSLVLGVVLGTDAPAPVVALLGTGFCGGLTTYSAFAVQAAERPGRCAASYVVATTGGCLAVAALGWWLAGAL